MSDRLPILLERFNSLKKSIKDLSSLSLSRKRLYQINSLVRIYRGVKKRLYSFGQVKSIVRIEIHYIAYANNSEHTAHIYYSDISPQDAYDYTKMMMEKNHKILNIKAINIKPGTLLEIGI